MKHRDGRKPAEPPPADAGGVRDRHPRNPLSHRLLAALFAVSLALATGGAIVELALDYHREVEELRTGLEAVQRNAEGPLAEALRTRDPIALDREFDRLLQLPPVLHVQLVASDGRHYEAGRPVQPLRDRLERTFKLEHIEAGRRQLLGSVHIEASTSSVKSRLFDHFLVLLAGLTVRLLVLAVFLLLFFRGLVTGHLAVIAARMRRLTSLNLREPLQLDRHYINDELQELVQSFNQMRRNMLHEIEIREAHDRSVAAEHALSQLTLDALPLPALRCTAEGALAWMNTAAETLCGQALTAVQGKALAEVLAVVKGSAEASVEVLLFKARGTEHPVSGYLQLARPRGSLECRVMANAVRNGEGQVLGVLFVVQEQTELPAEMAGTI